MNVTIRSIDLPGRVRLEYAEHGSSTGLPVIALHGVTDSRRSSERLLPHLPLELRLLALSSARPRRVGAAVDRLSQRRLRRRRGGVHGRTGAAARRRARPFVGSFNALRFAARHGGRALGLVLVGASASFSANPDSVRFWRDMIVVLDDPIPTDFVRDFQCSTLHQPVPAAFLDMVVGESLKVPGRIWRDAFQGFMTDDALAALPTIAAPTLIVWGCHDLFCRFEDQQALLAIPHARLVIYEQSGHTPHWEEPERFANDLTTFALAAADTTAATL